MRPNTSRLTIVLTKQTLNLGTSLKDNNSSFSQSQRRLGDVGSQSMDSELDNQKAQFFHNLQTLNQVLA